jgi:Cu+-exporting ATPase
MIFGFIPAISTVLKRKVVRGITIESFLTLPFATVVQFWIGKMFYLAAFKALKRFTGNMDLLIAVGTSSAYFYGVIAITIAAVNPDFMVDLFFETSTLLITFVLLGRLLENIAKGITSEALTKLLSLQADKAILVSKEEETNLEQEIDLMKIIQQILEALKSSV